MAEFDIPFNAGQSEAVDSKLLPNGMFSSLTNMRLRKDARLVSRYGLKYQVTNLLASTAIASAETPNGALFVDSSGNVIPRDASGTYFNITQSKRASIFGAVERISNVSIPTGDVLSCDIGLGSTGQGAGNVSAYYVAFTVGTNLYVAFVTLDGTIIRITNYSTTAKSPRVIVDGTTTLVTYADTSGNAIKLLQFDASGSGGLMGNLVLCTAGTNQYYDACLGPSGTLGIVYHRTATTTLSLSTVVYGTLTATERTTVATTNASRAAVAFNGSGTYQAVWIDGASFTTGTVKRQKYTNAGLSGGTTTLDSNGSAAAYPSCSWIASASKFYSLWNVDYGGSVAQNMTGIDNESAQTYLLNVVSVSKPVGIGSRIYAWCATGAQKAIALGSAAKYMLLDLSSGTTLSFSGGIPTNWTVVNFHADALCCQDASLSGATVFTSNSYDTRRSVLPISAQVTNSPYPGVAYYTTSLPFLGSSNYSTALMRVSTGSFGAGVRNHATGNGYTLFAGPRMYEFDGSELYESGLGDGPDYVASTTFAGSIPAGTYQYVVVWVWVDNRGLRHRSRPSVPISVTLGSPLQVTLTYSMFGPTERPVGGAQLVGAEIYRTTASGTVFYLLATTPNSAGPDFAFRQYTDNALDSAIISNAVLYTQGARGGLSGLLENDEPPPSSWIWAGNNRFIVGGLEEPTQVQWSKLFFAGEPVQWSSDAAFQARVDAPVTGVAALDGAWYVFTRNSIWVIGGDGPDDTGAGTFNDPVRLPSDVGCVNGRSIVETPDGLLFQGRSDRLYLLPRGSNAPQWVGQPVRDTLTTYPFISAAVLLPDENLVYFAVTTSDGATGRLVVYDTRIRQWYVDTFYTRAITSLAVYQGKLIIDGQIQQTPSTFADDDTGSKNDAISQQFVTGDIRSFGALGWGRTRSVTVLGEYRAPCKLRLEQSVDSGQTWQTAVTYDYSTGFTTGQTIEAQYRLPIVRSDSFRIRGTITPTNSSGVTTPSEALALNAMTIEGFKAPGSTRLGSGSVR